MVMMYVQNYKRQTNDTLIANPCVEEEWGMVIYCPAQQTKNMCACLPDEQQERRLATSS